MATAEHEARPRRLARLAQLFQLDDALGEKLSSCRRLAVEPAQPPDAAEERRAFERIGDVRGCPLRDLRCLLIGDGAFRLLRRTQAGGDQLAEPARAQQVTGDVVCVTADARQGVGGTRMDALPLRQHGVVGDRLLRERMPPAEAAPPVGLLLEQLLCHSRLERRLHGRLVGVGRFGQDRVVEGPAEHRRRAEHLDVPIVDPPEPKQNRVAHRLRDPQLVDRSAAPAGRGPEDVAPVERVLQHLLEHERVPLGPFVHQVAQLATDLVGVERRRDHLRDAGGRERVERDRLREPGTTPCLERRQERVTPLELVAAVGAEHEHAQTGEPSREVVEQLAGGRVGPVHVFEDEQHAPLAGLEREERDHRLEQTQPRLAGIADRSRRLPVAELREELRELARGGTEPLDDARRVVARQVVADSLDEREVRERELGLGAASPQDDAAELARAAPEHRREARLADSRLAGEQDEAAIPPVRSEEGVLESGKLVVTPHENRAEGALDHGVILSAPRERPDRARSNPALDRGTPKRYRH